MAQCPECGSEVQIPSDVKRGEIVNCQAVDCGIEIEVIAVNPLQLEMASLLGEGFGE